MQRWKGDPCFCFWPFHVGVVARPMLYGAGVCSLKVLTMEKERERHLRFGVVIVVVLAQAVPRAVPPPDLEAQSESLSDPPQRADPSGARPPQRHPLSRLTASSWHNPQPSRSCGLHRLGRPLAVDLSPPPCPGLVLSKAPAQLQVQLQPLHVTAARPIHSRHLMLHRSLVHREIPQSGSSIHSRPLTVPGCVNFEALGIWNDVTRTSTSHRRIAHLPVNSIATTTTSHCPEVVQRNQLHPRLQSLSPQDSSGLDIGVGSSAGLLPPRLPGPLFRLAPRPQKASR